MADNQTAQAQYELPEGTGNNPQEDYNENWEAADHAGGWLTAEIATGEGGVEGEWYTFDATGKAKKAQADSLDNCAIVFMLTEDTAQGLDGLFLKAGNWWKFSWGLDPSKIYYLSQGTPGAWTITQPASGLIIVLGRVDQDTETFHIAEGGGGGGGGLNDHATLTNLLWSVAGHTMDAYLDMAANAIINVKGIEINPDPTSLIRQGVEITGNITMSPSHNYAGMFHSINKTGGVTTIANRMYGVENDLRVTDAVNPFGYICGMINYIRAHVDMGTGTIAMMGTNNNFSANGNHTLDGDVYGTYDYFYFTDIDLTYDTAIGYYTQMVLHGDALEDVKGGYFYMRDGGFGTVALDVMGVDVNLAFTGVVSGDQYAYKANSTSTGIAGTRFAYFMEGTEWDYFLYSNIDTVPSYLAGVLQVDNTIWSDGTTGATPTSGAGQRFMYIPSKSALRMGLANGSDWDDANIGAGSVCFSDYRSSAKGSKTFVTGHNCGADGTYGVAMGFYCYASGSGSVAIGSTNTASGSNSIAIGTNVVAGTSAIALGFSITSSMTNSMQFGRSLASATTYYALFVGESITGGTGTRYRATGIGRWIGFSAVNDLMVIGEGVDVANPLIGTTADNLYIGMRSNLPSIVLDGTAGGVGVRALVNILAETFVSEQFYVSPTGSGINSEAYGAGASATGDNSLSVGYNVASTGIGTVQVGNSISTTGNNIVAMGENITFLTGNSIAIGTDIAFTTSFASGVALGTAITTGAAIVSMVIIGYQASASANNGVVIGQSANVDGVNSVSIGQNASVTGARAIGIGQGTSVTNFEATAVGENTTIAYQYAIVFGSDATVTGIAGCAIGTASSAGLDSIALGRSAVASFAESIALGRSATTTQVNEMVIGATSYEIDNLTFIITGDYLSVHTGFGWIDKNIYIGSNPNGYTTDYPNNFFRAETLSKTINGSAELFSFIVTMNGGTGTASDSFLNWNGQVTMQSVGGQHGNVRGIYQSLIILEGDFGDVSTAQYIAGQYLSTQFNEVTALKLWGSLYGIRNYVNANDGEITDDVFGYHFEGATISGVTLGGTSYAHYITLHTSWDWALYIATDVPSYFGGDIQMAATVSLDCFTNGAYFKPRRISQSLIPTPNANELMVWRDPDDNKTYLVYNDTDEGVRSVEMV